MTVSLSFAKAIVNPAWLFPTKENRLGHIKGGAEIEYAPSFYEAKDDMGKVSKVILTQEEATFKSGIMTWCGETLKKIKFLYCHGLFLLSK